jgi:hypothetical protein
MALVFQRNEISLECTSSSVTVPNNDVARLMYYLNCVCTAIDCNRDPEIQRFTNYNNWHYLSIDEQRQLHALCYTFSPDVFNNRVFFHSDELCGSSSNKFYRISQVRHQLVAAESIVIAGQVREVNEIMTYTMTWMKTNYFDPMERLVTRLGTSSRTNTYQPAYTPSYVRQPAITTSSSSRTAGRICCCIYCMVFIIPGIIGVIMTIVNSLNR